MSSSIMRLLLILALCAAVACGRLDPNRDRNPDQSEVYALSLVTDRIQGSQLRSKGGALDLHFVCVTCTLNPNFELEVDILVYP